MKEIKFKNQGKDHKVVTTNDWEHVAEYLFPEDIETSIAFAENDEEKTDVISQANDEISYVLGEVWDMCNNKEPGAFKALVVVKRYIEEIEGAGYEVNEYLLNEYYELYTKFRPVKR